MDISFVIEVHYLVHLSSSQQQLTSSSFFLKRNKHKEGKADNAREGRMRASQERRKSWASRPNTFGLRTTQLRHRQQLGARRIYKKKRKTGFLLLLPLLLFMLPAGVKVFFFFFPLSSGAPALLPNGVVIIQLLSREKKTRQQPQGKSFF